MITQRIKTLINDHTTCYLTCYITTQCHELVECFFLLLRSAKSATAKFIATAKLIETYYFADFVIFHVYLIQTYFKSKYLKKL